MKALTSSASPSASSAARGVRSLDAEDARVCLRRAGRHQSLQKMLGQLSEEIASLEQPEEGQAATGERLVAAEQKVEAGYAGEGDSGESLNAAREGAMEVTKEAEASPIEVVIGTSAMVQEDPTLPHRIATMVNTAYYASLQALLPTGVNEYERVSVEEVEERLEMGDAGPRANRVLHLALRAGQLVGCCSSTYQPPWTPDGCGHWGLLVVDPAAQGTGVASAIVASAEARLAGACALIQIEYDYTADHPPSEKLRGMYEEKLGFTCSNASSRRRSRGASEFRRCHKLIPAAMRRRERPVYLRRLRETLVEEVAEVAARQPGGVDRIGTMMTLQGVDACAQDGAPGAFSGLEGRVVSVLWWMTAEESAEETTAVETTAVEESAVGEGRCGEGREKEGGEGEGGEGEGREGEGGRYLVRLASFTSDGGWGGCGGKERGKEREEDDSEDGEDEDHNHHDEEASRHGVRSGDLLAVDPAHLRPCHPRSEERKATDHDEADGALEGSQPITMADDAPAAAGDVGVEGADVD